MFPQLPGTTKITSADGDISGIAIQGVYYGERYSFFLAAE